MITQAEFDSFAKLSPNDSPQAHWDALEALMPCLKDHLLIADQYEFKNVVPCRMITFESIDESKTELYAFATKEGRIFLGKTNQLSEFTYLDLGEFDAENCEIVALAVSGQKYFLGSSLNLWISVSRFEQDQTTTWVYHALAGLHDQKPKLIPLNDENPEQHQPPWHGIQVEKDKLPIFLGIWNFSTAYGCNPFEIKEEIKTYLSQSLPPIEVAQWERNIISYGLDKKLEVIRFSAKNNPLSFSGLSDKVNCIALESHKNTRNVKGVVGCDDGRLLAFRESNNQLISDWQQQLPDFPVAIGLVAASFQQGGASLLSISQNGVLRRLNPIEPKKIQRVWQSLWQNLGLTDIDSLIGAIKEQNQQGQHRKSACLYYLTVQLFKKARDTNTPLTHRLEAIFDSQVFTFQQRYNYLPELVTQELVSFLKYYADPKNNQPPHRQLSRIAELSDWLYKLYNEQFGITDRQEMDRHLRGIEWAEPYQAIKGLSNLKKRATQTMQAFWEQQTSVPSQLSELVKYANVCLEYWANPLLASEDILFKKSFSHDGVLGILGATSKEGTPCLLALTPTKLQVFALLPNTPQAPLWSLDVPEGYGFLQILPIDNCPHQVLALASNGQQCQIMLLGIPECPQSPNLEILHSCYTEQSPQKIYQWLASACPTQNDQTLLVLAGSLGQKAKLHYFHISDGQIQPITQPNFTGLTIRWLNRLEVAQTQQGFALAIAGAQSATLYLYRLDFAYNLQIKAPRHINFFVDALLSVCFDSKTSASKLIGGTYGGMVWCVDINPTLANQDLPTWTYRLKSAVRSLLPFENETGHYVLAGSGQGEVCMLSLNNGKRAWKETVKTSVYHIAPIGSHMVALALQHGWVSLFKKIPKSDTNKALTGINNCLQALDGFSKEDREKCPIWHQPDTQCLRGLHESSIPQIKDLSPILKNIHRLEARARFLRYWLNQNPMRLPFSDLSLRELGLVMAYPNQSQQSDQLIQEAAWRELKEAPYPPPDELYAYEMATAAYLRCLQAENKCLEELMAHQPNPKLFAHSVWLRTEYVCLLIRAARQSKSDEQSLLVKLLPYLLQLSPALLAHLQILLAGDERKAFQALDNLLNATYWGTPNASEVLVILIDNLSRHGKNEYGIVLLLAISQLNYCALENSSDPWLEWRSEGLTHLRQLHNALYNSPNQPLPFDQLIRNGRSLLPNDPCPPDHKYLKDRLAWIEGTRRFLNTPSQAVDSWKHAQWRGPMQALLQQTRHVISNWLNHEHKHLLQLVRPHLTMMAFCPQAGGKVSIEFSLQAEGQRSLEDVTIIVDANRPQGLLPPGALKKTLGYALYPSKNAQETLILEGFLNPKQSQINIRVTCIGSGNYKDESEWQFAIPQQHDYETDHFAVSTALPELYAHFLTRFYTSRYPLHLVILDSITDQQKLITDWDSRFPHQRIDLDAWVQDIGPGRKYSARSINAPFLTEALASVTNSQDRILLAPTASLLQRLVDGEAPGVLEAFWQSLKTRTNNPQPLLMLVSSAHACHLRQLGMVSGTELAVHFLPFEERGYAKNERLFSQQLITLVSNQADIDQHEAKNHVRRLGYDVRLILEWLRTLKHESRFITPNQFLEFEPIQKRLRNELRSLDAVSAILLLLGVRTQTQMLRQQTSAGLFSAKDYWSSTRKNPKKLIQKAGETFDERSLGNLNADAKSPQHLLVQGLSYEIGTLDTEAETFLNISYRFDPEQRQQAMQSLHDRGFGELLESVFHTASPYRDIIKAAYVNVHHLPPNQQDSKVYAFLFANRQLPLDAIPDDVLLGLSNEALQTLLPDANAYDIRRFRAFNQLWQKPGVGQNDLKTVLIALYEGETLSSITADRLRWDTALLDLGQLCIGIGLALTLKSHTYPQAYWFWLATNSQLTPDALRQALDTSDTERRRLLAEQPEDSHPRLEDYSPGIVITGPGCAQWQEDGQRRYAILKFTDIKRAAWQGHIIDSIQSRLRVQLRLSVFSPFKTNGALPPNSRIFKGREEELEFLRHRCRDASILIIGSRRVGKTSLLNQFYAWAKTQPDIFPIYLDLQGIKNRTEFLQQLKNHAELSTFITKLSSQEDTISVLSKVIGHYQRQGKLPLFLLNEIDGIAKDDAPFVEHWRGLNDQGLTHFIMTGYVVIGELGLPASAFFHFTEGTHFGGKAITLSTLNETGARGILDLLEITDLKLKWRSLEEKEQAYSLLLERSYRIPWVLQTYGRLLIETLERDRRDRLELPDVKQLLKKEGAIVWRYIEDIHYQDFAPGNNKALNRCGFFILLYMIARNLYFQGGHEAAIRDPQLQYRNAIDLGFTIGDVAKILEQTLQQQPLFENEKTAFMEWLAKLDLGKAFRLLTLTLILEPDPDATERFAFLLHIFPTELHRKYGEDDPGLDDLLLRSFAEFLKLTTMRTA